MWSNHCGIAPSCDGASLRPRFIPPLAGQEFMANLYVIKNKKKRYYTGITELDVKDRLYRHNKGDVCSTRSGRPWQLIYTEQFSTMAEARQREKQIKSWKGGNAFKKFLSRTAGSANGRQHGSEPWNLGSNPSPAVLERNKNKGSLTCPASSRHRRDRAG